MQVFDVSSCLLFHVCLLISRIGTLVYPFFMARIFCSVIPQAKIGVLFHAWNISDFYARGSNVRFSSLAFLHACMSANFTDWYLDYLFHIENVSFESLNSLSKTHRSA